VAWDARWREGDGVICRGTNVSERARVVVGKGSSSGKLGIDVVQCERIIKGDRRDTEQGERWKMLDEWLLRPKCARLADKVHAAIGLTGRSGRAAHRSPNSPDKRNSLDRLGGLLAHPVREDLP
jgi:hypothetical protein